MIISVNWLKKYTDIDLPIDELAALIGSRLVEIEDVVDLGAKYKDVLIVRVVECAPLEGSDHLNVTKIDDGGVATDVERDENGLVTVVCGAPNVRADTLAAWLPPASIVPETFDDAEPFVLAAKPLRGVVSNGMLASAKELDLFDDHTGIIVIDREVPAGSSFATVYELDDHLLDIENKSLTHRPDTFGIIGFAREVAAITGKQFTTPEWLATQHPFYGKKLGDAQTPRVIIDDPALSARYQAVVLAESDPTRQSPLEIQTYLARVGVRPINAAVDVTNYLMILTGQPLHSFDYDKVLMESGGVAEIHVRAGREGETLELLDGRTITLSVEDIVIAAGEKAIGLAGAMGGASTTTDENTKNIIVESATFDLYRLRATQMRHGIFSEAITRFTKGQPRELTAPVLSDAVRLIGEWTGAVRVSDVAEATGDQDENPTIQVTLEKINAVLGTQLSIEDTQAILESVEFAVAEKHKDTLVVAAPYWRRDIHIAEDIIEEIGRIRGFDNSIPVLPARTFKAVSPSDYDSFRQQLRNRLTRSGANEVLTYSFVHGDILKKAGLDTDDAYRITNSISPELQYYRQSLTPSLLGLVHPNVKQGYDIFSVYELNKIHAKSRGLTDEGVPVEADAVSLVIASSTKQESRGAAFYSAKAHLIYMLESWGVELAFEPLDTTDAILASPFESKRSAHVVDTSTGEVVGVIGEFKHGVRQGYKLPDWSAGFELYTERVYAAAMSHANAYRALSRYPGTERDVCFQVPVDTTYAELIAATHESLLVTDLADSVRLVDIYQPEQADTKNITIRIGYVSYQKTLSSSDVNDITRVVTESVAKKLGATIV